MIKNYICIIVVLTIIVAGCCGCNPFLEKKIENGFSDKNKESLRKDYELLISNSTIFVEGINIPGQDRNVTILFKMMKSELPDILSDNWNIETGKESSNGLNVPTTLFDITNYKFVSKYIYQKQVFTEIYCTEADDEGWIYVLFFGYRPKNAIK